MEAMTDDGVARPGLASARADKLHEAENSLIKIMELAEDLVEHVGKSETFVIDKELLQENAKGFLEKVESIRTCIDNEIEGLSDYIPFERDSYGPEKDLQISENRVKLAKRHLQMTLRMVEARERGQE